MRNILVLVAVLALLAGCIPYTVGTTAEPVRVGQRSSTMSTFVLPSFARLDSTRSMSNLAIDFETRWGLDQRSDLGIRVASGSGMIVNYKRLLSAQDASTRVAILSGMGFVNLGQHAHFELSLVASRHNASHVSDTGRDTAFRKQFVPYGGLRVMQVAPLAQGAVRDRPTAGGFVGLRVGSADFGISPEIGVFYDHSALGLRKGDLVIVPSISVHGDRLIRMMRDVLRGTPGGIVVMRASRSSSHSTVTGAPP